MFLPYQSLSSVIPNDVNNGFANHFHPVMMDQFYAGYQHGSGAPGGHHGAQYNPGFEPQRNGQQMMQRPGKPAYFIAKTLLTIK